MANRWHGDRPATQRRDRRLPADPVADRAARRSMAGSLVACRCGTALSTRRLDRCNDCRQSFAAPAKPHSSPLTAMTDRDWPAILSALLSGTSLTAADTAWAMDQVMSGEATPVQVAGFAVALRSKGETAEE